MIRVFPVVAKVAFYTSNHSMYIVLVFHQVHISVVEVHVCTYIYNYQLIDSMQKISLQSKDQVLFGQAFALSSLGRHCIHTVLETH